jgi:hypothetical protein
LTELGPLYDLFNETVIPAVEIAAPGGTCTPRIAAPRALAGHPFWRDHEAPVTTVQ